MTPPPRVGPHDVLPDPRSGPDKDAELVQRMFDRVAPRYDLANTLLSVGQDRHWRRVAAAAIGARRGDLVLDVASGTGMLARDLGASGAEVVALDFSWNMLRAGADRGDPLLLWCNADGTRLPFADATFDAVTIAFGLRNLPDIAAGLAEMARVTKPGGQILVLEFSTPVRAAFRILYHRYLLGCLPCAARLVTSDPAAYRYLAESIVAWPDQRALASRIAAAGFQQVRWKNLTGGIVAAHHARRSS